MRLGRCVVEDLGYLGCSADVLPILDIACTGKQTCDIQVTPLYIDSNQGCRKGLMKYLDASYICQTGELYHSYIYCVYKRNKVKTYLANIRKKPVIMFYNKCKNATFVASYTSKSLK